jgi:hypothetical protein
MSNRALSVKVNCPTHKRLLVKKTMSNTELPLNYQPTILMQSCELVLNVLATVGSVNVTVRPFLMCFFQYLQMSHLRFASYTVHPVVHKYIVMLDGWFNWLFNDSYKKVGFRVVQILVRGMLLLTERKRSGENVSGRVRCPCQYRPCFCLQGLRNTLQIWASQEGVNVPPFENHMLYRNLNTFIFGAANQIGPWSPHLWGL